MSQVFKDAAIAQSALLDYMKTHTNVANPKTIYELAKAVPETKNATQIYNFLITAKAKAKVASIREGKVRRYWYKGDPVVEKQMTDEIKEFNDNIRMHENIHAVLNTVSQRKQVNEQLEEIVEAAETVLPEVHVGKDKIVINTGKIRITIEV